MRAGRKPKPTALKQLAGNPGKRPLNLNEPKPEGVPTCPSHLDDTAKKEWRRISKVLVAAGLLTSADRAMLACYCEAYSRWVHATTQLKAWQDAHPGDSGAVIKSPTGQPIKNPIVAVIETAANAVRQFGNELGLSPAGRSGLTGNTTKSPDANPFVIRRPSDFIRRPSAERADSGLQAIETSVQSLLDRSSE